MIFRVESHAVGHTWPNLSYYQSETEARRAIRERQESGTEWYRLVLTVYEDGIEVDELWRLRR